MATTNYILKEDSYILLLETGDQLLLDFIPIPRTTMTDLITLDCYKDYKGIKSTEGDGQIQALISQVSTLVENYCNREFTTYAVSPKVEWHDAKNHTVYLTEFPIISITSVKTSEDGGVTQSDALIEGDIDKSGYFVDLERGAIFTQRARDYFLTSYDLAYNSLEIIYTAGYTDETLPEDLKLVIQDMVDYYRDEQRVPTKSLLGGNVENPQPYTANSWPPHIRRILDLYRYSS